MNTLALDTATQTGWAMRLGSVLYSGSQSFQHDPKRESPGMRFLRFSQWLREMIKNNDIGVIVYEQPHQRGGASTTVGVGLVAVLMAVCAELGVEHQAVHTAKLKKFATGKGNASKEDMLKSIEAMGVKDAFCELIDDNEVDAVALLLYSEAA